MKKFDLKSLFEEPVNLTSNRTTALDGMDATKVHIGRIPSALHAGSIRKRGL